MTVIACNTKQMAADKWSHIGNAAFRASKLNIRADGAIFGAAGDTDNTHAFRDWFNKNDPSVPYPTLSDNIEALVLMPDGQIRIYDKTPHFVIIEEALWSVGSGKGFALGAMAAGADPFTAVQLTQKFCTHTGGGTDLHTLESRRTVNLNDIIDQLKPNGRMPSPINFDRYVRMKPTSQREFIRYC